MAVTKSVPVLLVIGCCTLLLISAVEGKRKARDLTPYCGGDQNGSVDVYTLSIRALQFYCRHAYTYYNLNTIVLGCWMLFAHTACKAVVDEVRYSVGKVSPHKTYQVNSTVMSRVNRIVLVV